MELCVGWMLGLDFTGMPFDVAFRYLLTNAGFFLPGEAQKIDRITQVWASNHLLIPMLFVFFQLLEMACVGIRASLL